MLIVFTFANWILEWNWLTNNHGHRILQNNDVNLLHALKDHIFKVACRIFLSDVFSLSFF